MNYQQVLDLIQPLIESSQLIKLTLSKPQKTQKEFKRVILAPVKLKAGYHIQFSLDNGAHERHENLLPLDANVRLAGLLPAFRQMDARFADQHLHALMGTGDDLHLSITKELVEKPEVHTAALQHNRSKNHILPEGSPVDFLIDLGLMSAEGEVFKTRYDKFRQINRFVEFVDNLASRLPANKTLRIIDFGCGKAYLTFALYHYLVRIKGHSVQLLGLDLKQDVIDFCNELAKKLDMHGLEFKTGDIADHREDGELDMVVSLHACDTATDLALAFAIEHKTKLILCAPCCQHELFGQLKAPTLQPLIQHGLLKERFAALATDALRCQLLELNGYQVDMVEFVDPEHTPKNLMIRAWQNSKTPKATLRQDYERFRDMLDAKPYLEQLLTNRAVNAGASE